MYAIRSYYGKITNPGGDDQHADQERLECHLERNQRENKIDKERQNDRKGVITSYSIHYTKLYDSALCELLVGQLVVTAAKSGVVELGVSN